MAPGFRRPAITPHVFGLALIQIAAVSSESEVVSRELNIRAAPMIIVAPSVCSETCCTRTPRPWCEDER